MTEEHKPYRLIVTVSRLDDKGHAMPWETFADSIAVRPNGALDIVWGEEGHFLPADTWDSFEVKRKHP